MYMHLMNYVHAHAATVCVLSTACTPWYDGYRNTFLEKLRQEDHEPIHHYVSGMKCTYMYIQWNQYTDFTCLYSWHIHCIHMYLHDVHIIHVPVGVLMFSDASIVCLWKHDVMTKLSLLFLLNTHSMLLKCHTFVSVLLVVSSNESNVMEAFAGLYTKQKEAEQSKNSHWLTPHMFYYHILLHDVLEGDSARWVYHHILLHIHMYL